jgi:DNA-binding transcriptional MerR regulator
MKGFINKEVAKAIGINSSSVAYYTNKGFVIPEVADPKGRGTTRRYSRRNLVEFLLIGELQAHGMALPKIKEILGQARNNAPKDQFEHATGEKFKGGFNLFDGLNFDDPIIRSAEVFIIIYDDDKNLTVKFDLLARKKSAAELLKLPKEEQRNELKRFLGFTIDMYAHDSAVIINVSKLWRSVMDL